MSRNVITYYSETHYSRPALCCLLLSSECHHKRVVKCSYVFRRMTDSPYYPEQQEKKKNIKYAFCRPVFLVVVAAVNGITGNVFKL